MSDLERWLMKSGFLSVIKVGHVTMINGLLYFFKTYNTVQYTVLEINITIIKNLFCYSYIIIWPFYETSHAY